MKRIALLLVAFALGCRSGSETKVATPSATPSPVAVATPAVTPAPSPAPYVMPDSLHWFRNAAEYRALTMQVYRLAAQVLDRRVAGKASGTWAVILDADETILDNSQYLKEQFALGLRFAPRTWHEWTTRKSAGSVPGAVEFLKHIREKGGKIAIVTNRAASECAYTEENFKTLGVLYDTILCNPDLSNSSKEGRFAQVANGETPAGLPKLEVVMWVGDNIQDFPGMSQAVRDDPSRLSQFGERFIVLPNPTYGSWERSTRQ